VLHPQLVVFLFFGCHYLFQVRDHVVVHLNEGLVALNRLLEVLVGALLLELLDLGPKSVRKLLGSSERVKRLRKAKLLQEVLKLLVLSLNLCKFVAHDALEDFLKLVLLLTDRWRNQVSEQVLKRVLRVESFQH